MAKRLYFILFILIGMSAKSQMLKPLMSGLAEGQGFSDEVIATATDNNLMYVATRHYNGQGKGHTVTINRWNGFYWQQLPAVVFSDSSASFKTMAVFRGQVYIGGNFIVKSPVINNTKTLIRFNSLLNKWEAVLNSTAGGFNYLGGNGIINTMAVFRNQLFIGGYFTTIINNDTTQNIIAFNGNSFVRCGLGNAVNTGTNGLVNSLLVINDSLFVAGTFTKAGGLNASNIAIIGDSLMNWKPSFFNNSSNGIYKLASYQGSPVVLSNDAKMYIRNNGLFQTISTGMSYSQVSDIEEYNNELWASGIFSFSGVPCTIARYSNGWSSANLPNINTTNLFKYRGGLYLISTNDMAGNIRINRIAQIAFAQTRMGGRVYRDVNNNCKFDMNLDKPFSNKVIRFSGADNFNVKTDSDGYYSIYVNATNTACNVSLLMPKNWEVNTSCSKSNYTVTTSGNSNYDSLDFILKPIVTGADIKINLASNSGFTTSRDYTDFYTVTYTNNGTQDISTMAGIELVFDKKLINFNAVPAASVINGNKAIWSFNSLKVGEQRSISISLKAKTDSFNLNDKINFIASSAFLADIDKSDNADTLVQQIMQSTPNQVMKDVYPLPLANDSFSLVSAQSNEINYIIRFENSSLTDTVRTVIVIDTIDINASIEYTQETGASHPYTTKMYNCPPALGKGVLVWTFNNINLVPFESIDEINNRGHIGFSIRFNSSLPLGSIIKNKAYVVFDYYEPMQTNTTYSKVSVLNGIKTSNNNQTLGNICANPVSGTIHLLRDFDVNSNYKLYNSAGALVMDGMVNSKSINISHLSQGIYFITIEENSHLTSQKIVIN